MSRLPMVRPREMVAALKRAGFEELHQKGSHLYLFHPQKKRMTTVPFHPGDLDRVLMKKILRQAGISEEEFRKFLR